MVPCVARTFLTPLIRGRATSLRSRAIILCVAFDDAAFAIADEEDDFVTLRCCRQLGLDAADGVGDVEAAEVEITVDVLDVADALRGETAAAQAYRIYSQTSEMIHSWIVLT